MSMVVTRFPLEPIGMNAPPPAGGPAQQQQRRRSARLSHEGEGGAGAGENAAAVKEGNGGATARAAGGKKRKVYDQEVDGFSFTKKRAKATAKEPAARPATAEKPSPAKAMPPPSPPSTQRSAPPVESKTADKKTRRRLPTTPEPETQKPVRRSKRLSNEGEESSRASPHKPAHAKSHANHERSPSPHFARPVTVEKKRKKGADGVEEQKTMRIQLPFQDTPVIRRNKEMRKTSAEGGSRRSSSGMRGRRASSLIDEGRGNALPHAEVSSSEFYKHISGDLTEPRRMRLLLGWCGTRALPSKPDPPKDSTPAASLEFQALQAARVIQEELSQDLITKGSLSDWFSRDDDPPTHIALRKKPNPRNVANAAKAEELEKELERLNKERAEWDMLVSSATSSVPPLNDASTSHERPPSPLQLDLIGSPQRRIYEQLQANPVNSSSEPSSLEHRLRHVTSNLEFAVDQFAHGVHALSTTRETGERLANHTLAEASDVLAERERERRNDAKAVDPLVALRGLARVLNAKQDR